MTYKDNITAILECNFPGFKQEIIDNACNRILELKTRDDAVSSEEANMVIYRFRVRNRNSGKVQIFRYVFDRDMISRFRWIELVNYIFDAKNAGNWELISIEKGVS